MMKPLAGMRLIAVEQYGAAPYGTMLLAALGADIIKVEHAATGGDPSRHVGGHGLGPNDCQYFQAWNLGKRSVTLDIKSAEGKQQLAALARDAEAVVNNLRGSLPAQLGLDYATLGRINPAVVKPGAPGAPLGARGGAAPNAPIPANAPPNAPPQGQPLPKANTLPVPGAKGAPPPPPSVATGAPATVNPSAKPGTAPAQQGATLPPGAAPGAAGAPKGPPTANVPPPVAGVPKAGGLPITGAKPVVPDSAHRQGTAPGAAPPSAANLPAKPNVTVAPKPPQSAPSTANAPPLRPAPQLAKPTPPSPPPLMPR